MGDSNITTGEVILPDCPTGHVRSRKDIGCVLEVHFHSEPNISFYDAQAKCVNNGWVLATAEEVQTAWEKLDYNHFGYGMIAHGPTSYKMALPIQKDLTPSLKRGANIGISGGNDGFFYVLAGAVTRKQQIVVFGEATIIGETPDCPPGHFQNANGACIPDVRFFRWFDPDGFNLEAAKIICYENGWILATAKDVQTAWANKEKGLDLLVYGMLADGTFAVPIQQDNDLFQSGPNIGATGGNEGFFYLPVNNPLPPVPPPKLTPQEFQELYLASIPKEDRERFLHFINNPGDYAPPLAGTAMSHCDQPFGANLSDNWMINMWQRPLTVSSKDLLTQAAVAYLKKKQLPVNDGVLLQLSAAVRTAPVARFKFAPFLLKECFEALVATHPTQEQAEYKSAFESNQSCVDYHRAKATLQAWNDYQGKGYVKSPSYLPNTLSNLNFHHSPSIEGFLDNDPISYGQKGGETVALLYFPMSSYAGILDHHPFDGDIAKQGADMMGAVAGAGSAIAVATVLVGSTYVFQKVQHKLFMKAAISAGKKLGGGAGSTTKVLNRFLPKLLSKTVGGIALGMLAAAVDIGMVVAEVVKKATYEKKLRDNANRVHRFEVAKFLNVPDNERENRSTALFTLMVKHLIAEPANNGQFSLALPPIPAPTFQTALEALSAAVRSRDIKEVKFYGPGMSLYEALNLAKENGWFLATKEEVQEAWTHHQLDVYAYGMMADGSFAVPVQSDHSNFKKGPNLGVTGGNQGFFYTTHKEVKFHPQGMTLEEAQRFALQHAWLLATPSEVQNAWRYHQLNVYAYGMMADGSFAVPVQSDQSNFKKGPNLGVTGGNQGFFYTTAKPSAAAQAALDALKAKEEAAAQAVVAAQEAITNKIALANARAREEAAAAQAVAVEKAIETADKAKEEAAAAKAREEEAAAAAKQAATEIALASATALAAGGPKIIQNKLNQELYLHNQNGVFEDGPIQSDWVGARWKILPVHSGWVRIQNQLNTDHYLYSEPTTDKVLLGPILPNWAAAMWRIIPAENGGYRIQNSWNRNDFMHVQNGFLELGAIEPNWQGAIWKVE